MRSRNYISETINHSLYLPFHRYDYSLNWLYLNHKYRDIVRNAKKFYQNADSYLDLLNDNLVIYKNPKSKLSINEIIILVNKYLSSIVFYLIIFLLFFSKKNTNKNSLRVSLIYSIIFLIYFLIISNIHLANFQLLFMTSITLIFILLFFKFFINE